MRHPLTKSLLVPGACLALLLALAASASGQAAGPDPVATKFDEFGDLRWCDLSARLDNFAIQLQMESGAQGYLILYGPEDDTPGNTKAPLWALQDYLVNNRGISRERLKAVYGGRYRNKTEVRFEVWVAPTGAGPPDLKEYKNDSGSFTGKFAEFETHQGADGEGPSLGEGLSLGDATVHGFADALRQQPKTLAYVVAYSSRTAATGAWRRGAKDIARQINVQSVPAERVKIIFAGYDEKLAEHVAAKMQLWILPEGAPPPAAEAAAERRPEKAVKLGDFYPYFVGNAALEKLALEGLADVLRADEQLSACLIVRLPAGPPDPERKEPSADDLLRLIERWKAGLVADHRIDQTRLAVSVALETEEHPGGYLETWVVPQGASLPDPYPPTQMFEEVSGEEAAGEENPQ